MKISHSFAYEEKDGGAVILRCFLRDGNVEVPESLDGLPVTSLAPYAFSKHADPNVSGDPASLSSLPDALCGNALIKLTLPSTIRTVGRYCFYNCEKLTSIEFAFSLDDWGSGAFSGCHKIREIRLRSKPEKKTGLKKLLGEIREEVLVTFLSPEDKITARLFFPSFYEEGVENTPARILVDEVHGTGILYRNAFNERRLDFAGYDALFPYALAQEDEGVLIRLVLCRLFYPFRLKGDGKCYKAYLEEHLFEAGAFLMDQGDTKRFSWLLHNFESENEREVLKELSKKAALEKKPQMQSITMAFLAEIFPDYGPKKRLEL